MTSLIEARQFRRRLFPTFTLVEHIDHHAAGKPDPHSAVFSRLG